MVRKELDELMDNQDRVIQQLKQLKSFTTEEGFIKTLEHDLAVIKDLKINLNKWIEIAWDDWKVNTWIVPSTSCVLALNIAEQEIKKEGAYEEDTGLIEETESPVATEEGVRHTYGLTKKAQNLLKKKCEACPLQRSESEECGHDNLQGVISPLKNTPNKKEKGKIVIALSDYETAIKIMLTKLKITQKETLTYSEFSNEKQA